MQQGLFRLVRFGAVGGGVTLLGYALFLAGMALGLHYLAASVLAWAGGVVVGFVAHRRLTFDDRGAWRGQMTRYLGVYLLQLMVGTATLAALIDWVGLAPWIAYLVNILFTATLSYGLMHLAVFAPGRRVLPG